MIKTYKLKEIFNMGYFDSDPPGDKDSKQTDKQADKQADKPALKQADKLA